MTDPRYPIYIISKGRADICLTAKALIEDRVPFSLVVEPQEEALYRANFPDSVIRVLPFSNLGLGSIPARNWVKEHATASGAERHWILDDNIARVERWYKGQRIPCNAGIAMRVVEDFTDRYDNVAISGLNYHMFGITAAPPIYINHRVYSFILLNNAIPFRWRGRYNEDTDLCLQALTANWCTVLVNAFLALKTPTMTMKGGNATELYQGDGRLKMANALERMWPGIVKVSRRFSRPQHVVDWNIFTTPLRLKPGVVIEDLPDNEYGMALLDLNPAVQKSAALRELMVKFAPDKGD